MTGNACAKGLNHRSSNIELLRIIAMVMIVAHHLAVHSGFVFPAEIISYNRLWVQLIQLGGKIGVNIFVLISGYFLVTSGSVKTNKVIKLWLQIFTYAAVIFLAFVLLGAEPFNKASFLKNMLPITFARWWFPSCYFILYLLSPFINKMLNALDKKEYKGLLLLLLLCWCIIPTILNKKLESNPLLWFIFLYALAGYIRLHVDLAALKSGRCILIGLAVMAVTYSLTVVCDVLGKESAFFAARTTYLYELQTLPVFLASLMLFVGFASLRMGYVPFINTVASATFGVYLLHDNGLIRPLLWEGIFKTAAFRDSNILIPYTLFVIAAVFVCGTLVELFRIHVIERAYMKGVNSLSSSVDKGMHKLFSSKPFTRI